MSEDTDDREPAEHDEGPQEHTEEPTETDSDEEPTRPEAPASGGDRVPLSELRDRLEARNAAASEDAEVAPDSPLSELAREASASSEAEESELFEKVDVGAVDAEAVWDAVVDEGGPSQDVLDEPAGPATGAEPTKTPAEHVIDKREYCQRCEFFSEPPTVACTHEGTEIVELADNEHFRVRNCPKVEADEEELESLVEDEQP